MFAVLFCWPEPALRIFARVAAGVERAGSEADAAALGGVWARWQVSAVLSLRRRCAYRMRSRRKRYANGGVDVPLGGGGSNFE
jgi:hypothetical protein